MMPATTTTPARTLNQGFGLWAVSGEVMGDGETAAALAMLGTSAKRENWSLFYRSVI